MTYIAPAAKALAHVDRIVDWNRGQKPAPVTVEWDLSNRCVLGCQSCHFAHTHTKGPWAIKDRRLPMAYDQSGDLADVGTVMLGLSQMVEAGVEGVVWSGGGEPTTHPSWQRIVQHAADLGLEQGMYTLGGLLDKDGAALLAEHLSWVVVSLDCQDAKTYSLEKGVQESRFAAACNGIRMLSSHRKATVGVSFLLHAWNFFDVKRMYALAMDLGATYATFRPTIDTDASQPSVCSTDRSWVSSALLLLREIELWHGVEVNPERFREYRDWQGHGYSSCTGVRLNTTVTPDGRMWLCPQRRGVGDSLGDLRRESFADIWARHPGQFDVDAGCRVMCRLHPVNATLDDLARPRVHGAFV